MIEEVYISTACCDRDDDLLLLKFDAEEEDHKVRWPRPPGALPHHPGPYLAGCGRHTWGRDLRAGWGGMVEYFARMYLQEISLQLTIEF